MQLNADTAKIIAYEHVTKSHGILFKKGSIPYLGMVEGLFTALKSAGLNVPSGDEIRGFSHAIGPFVVLADDLAPAALIETVAHECQHVHQFFKGEYEAGKTVGNTLGGGFNFAYLYLAGPEARVRFEVQAYTAGLEVRRHLGLALPTAKALSEQLGHGYNVGADGVKLAYDMFRSALLSVNAGVYVTKSGKGMIETLIANGVDPA